MERGATASHDDRTNIGGKNAGYQRNVSNMPLHPPLLGRLCAPQWPCHPEAIIGASRRSAAHIHASANHAIAEQVESVLNGYQIKIRRIAAMPSSTMIFKSSEALSSNASIV